MTGLNAAIDSLQIIRENYLWRDQLQSRMGNPTTRALEQLSVHERRNPKRLSAKLTHTDGRVVRNYGRSIGMFYSGDAEVDQKEA